MLNVIHQCFLYQQFQIMQQRCIQSPWEGITSAWCLEPSFYLKEGAIPDIRAAWDQVSIFYCYFIYFGLIFVHCCFFLIYENVKVYWTCLWLEEIIKGCMNKIWCQINITLPSPTDNFYIPVIFRDVGSFTCTYETPAPILFDQQRVFSEVVESIVPIFQMSWNMSFLACYF